MINILYIGQFKDASGYGNAARGYLRVLDKYLDKQKYNLKIFALNFEKQDYSKDFDKKLIDKYNLSSEELIKFVNENSYTLFLHTLPDFYQIDTPDMPLNKCFINKNCKKKINFISWETDKCPDAWREIYNNNIFDILCVSCSWNKQMFKKELNIDIDYIPLAIYDYFSLEKKTKFDKFKIFSMSQWHHKKNFDILVRAYYQEFFDQDDVELVIKTYRNEASGADEKLEKDAIVSEILKYKNECTHYGRTPICKIALKTGVCSNEEIKSFYESSDVFCLPTRGEGFGMTIAQALLSGVPCIIPDKGGHIDFLDKENNYFIDSNYEYLYGLRFHVYSSKDMKLVEPSLTSTREKLRESYNDWKNNNLKIKSNNVKNFTKNFLDEEEIFKKLRNLL